MKLFKIIVSAALVLSVAAPAFALVDKSIKEMSREEMIKAAKSAAPEHISKDATVLIPGPGGQWTEAVKGTSEITCIPDVSGQEKADPFCGDKAGIQWIKDAIAKKDKPSNTEPGVGYMAQGGWHWEKDGVVVAAGTPDAKKMQEPPHWMVFWPVDAGKAKLPTEPGDFGSYVMYEGTPYAHVMVYQNPKEIEEPEKGK